MHFRVFYLYILISLIFIGAYIYIHIYVYGDISDPNLHVSFLDVGQGDSIYIRTPSNNRILIDTGPGSILLRQLGETENFFRRKVDLLILTHEDLDHSGGALIFLDRFDVSYVNGLASIDKPIISAFNQKISEQKIGSLNLKQGDRIIIDNQKNIYLDVLFPNFDVADDSGNDRSIVLKLIYGDTSFLLTGDISQKIEKYLVATYGDNLRSDVLKVAHHGSKNSSSEIFLEKVAARIFVIQVGEENSFGHPSGEVIDRLKKFSEKILQTRNQKTIILKSDGKNIFIEK